MTINNIYKYLLYVASSFGINTEELRPKKKLSRKYTASWKFTYFSTVYSISINRRFVLIARLKKVNDVKIWLPRNDFIIPKRKRSKITMHLRKLY